MVSGEVLSDCYWARSSATFCSTEVMIAEIMLVSSPSDEIYSWRGAPKGSGGNARTWRTHTESYANNGLKWPQRGEEAIGRCHHHHIRDLFLKRGCPRDKKRIFKNHSIPKGLDCQYVAPPNTQKHCRQTGCIRGQL